VQYNAVAGNPFAVLTAIVAPAILTNASSVLALGTSNRLARVVDRTRIVASQLATFEPGTPDHQLWSEQLAPLHVRSQLLVKALRCFYAGLGLFAASALVSVAGSIVAYSGNPHRRVCGLRSMRGLRAHGSRNATRRKIPRGGSKNPSGSAPPAATTALAENFLKENLTSHALH
jgi:hypothetical protein